MPFANEIVRNQRSRQFDKFGSGQFGAKRGKRSHSGLDIEVRPGEDVFSPIKGNVIREALPYKDDLSFRGLLIKGVDEWTGYEVKMFYVEGSICGGVSPGTRVGHAQDLGMKYPGIKNHVHLEVRHNGKVLSPHEIYGLCF